MMKVSNRWHAALAVCFSMVFSVQAITYTVAKDGTASFTTIMAAIRVAQPGDIVQITDLATYAEQVTIDSTKNGLTLCSKNPTSLNKPRIVWRDIVNVGPRTYTESQDDRNTTYDRNGALQILNVRNVTIDGIAIDGGGPYSFGYDAIWNNQYPLQHGNGAIAIWNGGAIHIKNCSISNAYFGINFKDRNQGGVFGNPNPADNEPWKVVPLSGFGKTGNHIIEYNRIHNNSFGMFFESIWDLGSTIRYNLIYENHHYSDAFAAEVKGKTSEGNNQPGGAMMFKDFILSPLAIYNNTFWHNYLELAGNWKTGYQHLVFNNLFGAPFRYPQAEPNFSNQMDMDISRCLPNRMYNCVFAAHAQAPTTSYVAIFNNMTAQPVNNVISPGAYINTGTTPPMTNAAEVHWLETPFLSTDTASTSFLTPNWSDPLVSTYISNKGWAASGVRDPDGSAADIGAIPQGGGRPVDVSMIIPTLPVLLTGNTATINYTVSRRAGNMTTPLIKLHRWVGNLPYDAGPWSSGWAAGIIPAANIRDVAPVPPVIVGANSYTFTLPVAQTTRYGFLELLIEGTGSNSLPFTSTVGFIPYRKLENKFLVDVLDIAGNVITTVRAGDTVKLRIRAVGLDGNPFPNPVNPTEVRLQSGFTLFSTAINPPAGLTLPTGVSGGSGGTISNVMFTRVPVTSGGFETVIATGNYNDLIFIGASVPIKITPGLPETVVFQDPPSMRFQAAIPVINPGIDYPGLLYVYDRFGNRTNTAATINLSSLQPTVGDIVPPVTIPSDTTGSGTFNVQVTNGSVGEVFYIRAEIAGKLPDTARLKVGAPSDRLWIFYGDTAAYNLTTELRGTVGERLPVVIMCGKVANLDSVNTDANFTFLVTDPTLGLQFYASSADPTPATNFPLVNGRRTVWVTSNTAITVPPGGHFAVTPDGVNTVRASDPRDKIYFVKPAVVIDSAFYYTDNGFGRVDRVEVYYKDTLAFVPDSMILYWPSKIAATPNRRVVTAAGGGMTLAADKKHVTVILATPFPDEITSGSTGELLGTSWNRSNAAPTLPAESTPFKIQDRVGPLAMRALLVERIGGGAGTDTLYVSFSESIVPASLIGASLILKQGGVESVLTVSAATPAANGNYRLVVTGTVKPAEGDSLRLQPGGPITDSTVWLNTPHLNNRPVVIGIKPVPATILSAYYKDDDANGHVDRVVLQFAKKVVLADCIIALEWGLGKLDTALPARLSFAVPDSIVAVNTVNFFSGLTAIKTSGLMKATVSYLSIPGEIVQGDVADSAAPVLTDSPRYYPGSTIDETTSNPDTLVAFFSEPIGPAIAASAIPFNLFSVSTATPYTLSMAIPFTPSQSQARFVVAALNPASIGFPRTGDSVWINPGGGVQDVASSCVQINRANRRVFLKVLLTPSWKISLSKNPFNAVTPIVLNGFPSVTGQGMAITLRPIGRMGDVSNISVAEVAIYDAVGNTVVPKTLFTKNTVDNIFHFIWNGTNKNNREVATGTYLAVLNITDVTGKTYRELKRIGVKR